MLPISPKKNNLQKPLSLQQLDDQLKRNIYKCLCQPFPHYKGCTTVFSGNDEGQNNAIQEARSDLSQILAAGHLIQDADFLGTITRLERIAKAFCCSKHQENPDDIKTFAYYWVVCELFDDFLIRRRWSWDESKWQCLASNDQEACSGLKRPVKSDREMVYRSLIRLAVYANFSENLNDLFFKTAISDLVYCWICVDHKRAADNVEAIKAKLEEDTRQICVNQPSHGLQGQNPLGAPDILLSSRSTDDGIIEESPPSRAALLSPRWNQTSPGDSAVRRRSAPMVLSSSSHSRSGPTTPDRPPPVRSAASDAMTSRRLSGTAWLPATTDQMLQSASYAPQDSNATAPDTINFFRESNKKEETLRETVNAVLALIKQRAQTGSNLYQPGWIYILQIPEYPGYVKIGRTTQLAKSRKERIANCKKGVNIETVGGGELLLVDYLERLEKIIQADLYNERRCFRCSCSSTGKKDSHNNDGLVKHGEWFEINANDAVRRVEQWRNWMRQEPYEKAGTVGEGKLKDLFMRRVIYCEKNDVSSIPEERWKIFMTPFYVE